MQNNLDLFQVGNVNIAFTNRHGGCSAKPYDSLNLGIHVGDDPADVLRNRELVHQGIERTAKISPPKNWLFLNQTHENNLVYLNENTVIDNNLPPTADAAVTKIKNQPLVIMTSDCGPLVISGRSIVGVVHASWRSIRNGILESCFDEINSRAPDQKLHCLLGPCIHPENYEFDPVLLDDLSKWHGPQAIGKTLDQKPAYNLPAVIKAICESRNAAFEDLGIDTFSSKNHFSYRRDGLTGRQGVIAWLK